MHNELNINEVKADGSAISEQPIAVDAKTKEKKPVDVIRVVGLSEHQDYVNWAEAGLFRICVKTEDGREGLLCVEEKRLCEPLIPFAYLLLPAMIPKGRRIFQSYPLRDCVLPEDLRRLVNTQTGKALVNHLKRCLNDSDLSLLLGQYEALFSSIDPNAPDDDTIPSGILVYAERAWFAVRDMPDAVAKKLIAQEGGDWTSEARGMLRDLDEVLDDLAKATLRLTLGYGDIGQFNYGNFLNSRLARFCDRIKRAFDILRNAQESFAIARDPVQQQSSLFSSHRNEFRGQSAYFYDVLNPGTIVSQLLTLADEVVARMKRGTWPASDLAGSNKR